MKMTVKKHPVFYVLFLCLCGIPLSALTHSGATGIVKERMDAMGDMGEKSKRVANMFKGKTEFDADVIKDAADAFVIHGRAMASLFPDHKASREGHKTEALPVIWAQWEEFVSIVDEFVQQSEQLQQTVATEDDLRVLKVAFFKTTKQCSACHKRFRRPKE